MIKFTRFNNFIGNLIILIKWRDASSFLMKSQKDEWREIGKKIRHMKPTVFPYDFVKKYDDISIDVFRDDDDYPFVIDNGYKMYGKKRWSNEEMKEYYVSLLLEQDTESPHCYIPESRRMPDAGDVLVDLGAAEGIFSLRVIDRISKCYLFECDDEWVEPLKRTFSKWKDRIVLVDKYIGDVSKDNVVSLDDYFGDSKVDYIKADIEGMEIPMLNGGEKVLGRCKRIVTCAYHYQNDESEITNVLLKHGYNISVNNGYMLYYSLFRRFKRPYLRRGVVYGERIGIQK